MESRLWWHGPEFLVLQKELWPETDLKVDKSEDISGDYEDFSQNTVCLLNESEDPIGLSAVIDLARFSSLTRLLNVTGWVFRFINAARKQPTCDKPILTAEEIELCLIFWVKSIQKAMPIHQMNSLQKFKNLGAFVCNDGILRCRGRFHVFENECDYPILLRKNHLLTDLIIKDCHCRLHHSGVRLTLAQLRLRFWIPCGFSSVKKVLKNCLVCRKWQGGPFKVPESPPLPYFRHDLNYPFANTGIDYFGPLFVKTEMNEKKVWVCLFLCATVRAVHLELVEDLTTEQFLLCMRRLIAIYGCPKLLISDNAPQFKASHSVFKSILIDKSIQEYSTQKGIQWKFIPEYAPWMGRFYERLVGSVKSVLKKSLGKSCLTLVQLQTLLSEIASIVNSRPLVAVDFEEGQEVLSPNHFLSPPNNVGVPMPTTSQIDPDFLRKSRSEQELIESWRKGQNLLNQAWTCWRNEYLVSLRARPDPNMQIRNLSSINLAPGVIVLVKENLPRCRWKIGKIAKLNVSLDNQVRSAVLTLASGKSLTRPLKLLFPVESSTIPNEEIHNAQNSIQHSTPVPVHGKRQQRMAAVSAKHAIKHQLQEEEEDAGSDGDEYIH